MKAATALDAMGKQDGDYIELHNQWARVTVSRDRVWNPKTGGSAGWVYTVSGDIADFRARIKEFKTSAKALAYAFESLALYQKGAYR